MRTIIHKNYATEHLAEDEQIGIHNLKQFCETLQGYLDMVPLAHKSSVHLSFFEDQYGDPLYNIYYDRPLTEDEQTKAAFKGKEVEAHRKYLKLQEYLKLKEEFGDN